MIKYQQSYPLPLKIKYTAISSMEEDTLTFYLLKKPKIWNNSKITFTDWSSIYWYEVVSLLHNNNDPAFLHVRNGKLIKKEYWFQGEYCGSNVKDEATFSKWKKFKELEKFL